MTKTSALEAVIRRDRWVIGGALSAIVVLCWIYLIREASVMDGMGSMSANASMIRAWSLADFVMMFVMWAVMMIGMMLPSATPMILLYARIERSNRAKGHVIAPTTTFVLGYAVAWSAFSLVATVGQWILDQTAQLSPMMVTTSHILGGSVLIAAGLYQWTPIKYACLAHCRSPIQFVTAHWQKGVAGAFKMGLHHGAYCVGCCWVLMALLFVGGVMNLLWIAAIAFAILAEKLLPYGAAVGRLAGGVLIILGIATIAGIV